MSKVSDAMIDDLLDRITDYEGVSLSEEELEKLQAICDRWKDFESIETEINLFLQTIGYTYDDSKCIWIKQ